MERSFLRLCDGKGCVLCRQLPACWEFFTITKPLKLRKFDMPNTQTVEIRGRGNSWHIYYPNEERLASPFPVYDREGNYKETLWCGSDANGMTEAHFTGSRDEAMAYALYLVPGCSLNVTKTLTKNEALERARRARNDHTAI